VKMMQVLFDKGADIW